MPHLGHKVYLSKYKQAGVVPCVQPDDNAVTLQIKDETCRNTQAHGDGKHTEWRVASWEMRGIKTSYNWMKMNLGDSVKAVQWGRSS